MLIAISYFKGDLHLAKSLAEQMRSFGPHPNHRLITLRDVSTEENPFLDVGFSSVKELTIRDTYNSWPQSCNIAFGTVAKYIQYKEPRPWLWLEPDCVLFEGCFDAIEREYQIALTNGKVFLGAHVTGIEGARDHMSGVAVYPGVMTKY